MNNLAQKKTCLSPQPVVVDNARKYQELDLRLKILQALRKESGYTANDRCLLFAVREKGHAISIERIHVELAWLDQIAHVLDHRISGNTHVAMLNDTGFDVVEGTLSLPGIATLPPVY